MRCATAQPCTGAAATAFMMSRSSVPWTRSTGLPMSPLDGRQEHSPALVDRQGESSRQIEIPGEMEEDRRGKTQRIDPIEHATVPTDQGAVILDAAIPLDRGHDQAT